MVQHYNKAGSILVISIKYLRILSFSLLGTARKYLFAFLDKTTSIKPA